MTQSIDVSQTTKALVCSQIFGVLPYRTFRRQRFDSFTSCTCVSDLTAVCEPDTFYPTVAPGTPEAALAHEHSPQGGDKFVEVLNAFSVQQTCFFEHLRGQKMSPPRPCAFSWARGGRPACDCAQPPAAVTPDTEAQEEEVTAAVEVVPTAEQAAPVTERANKAAVQSAQRTGETDAEASERLQQVGDSELPGERSAELRELQRRPLVDEASHLRRARSARRF